MLECLKMFKISMQVKILFRKVIETWKVELVARGDTLVEDVIKRGTFHDDSPLPLLFVIAMMALNYTLRKWRGGYKFTNAPETINLLYRWYKDIFQEWKWTRKSYNITRIYSLDIGMEYGIRKCAMIILRKGKNKSQGKNRTSQ